MQSWVPLVKIIVWMETVLKVDADVAVDGLEPIVTKVTTLQSYLIDWLQFVHIAYTCIYTQWHVLLNVGMEACVQEITHARVPEGGLEQPVSGHSAPFPVSMVDASLLRLSARVRLAGEDPTVTKVFNDSRCALVIGELNWCLSLSLLYNYECAAACSPPCLNGGTCIVSGFCLCPYEWQGPLCEYSRYNDHLWLGVAYWGWGVWFILFLNYTELFDDTKLLKTASCISP